jgi:hypothetical protein
MIVCAEPAQVARVRFGVATKAMQQHERFRRASTEFNRSRPESAAAKPDARAEEVVPNGMFVHPLAIMHAHHFRQRGTALRAVAVGALGLLCRDACEQRLQLFPFARREDAEDAIFDRRNLALQRGKPLRAGLRQGHDMPPPVARIALALDVAGRIELVEQHDKPRRLDAQNFAEVVLGERSVAQFHDRSQVDGSQARGLCDAVERAHDGIAELTDEPAERITGT